MAKRVIVWEGDKGTAPDGTRYWINSEQSRGETRQYWAEFNGAELQHPTDNWAMSKDKAKQSAEAHYQRRLDRLTSDDSRGEVN